MTHVRLQPSIPTDRRVSRRAVTLLLSMLVALAGCAHAQTPITDHDRTQSIAKLADAVTSQPGVPGMAIAVIRNGHVFQRITVGYANLARHEKVSSRTPFQLASTTKIFSSTGVLLLVAEGKIRLGDPIGEYLDNLPEKWKHITIQQLLSDTSGLPDVTRTTGQIDMIADDWQHALPIIASKPFRFRPGSDWAYTQTNYAILQRLVEHVTGMPFEDFMHKRLFAPLGMHDTFFPGPDHHCAMNYKRAADGSTAERPELAFPRYVHAAGGLCSSLHDQILWSKALEAGKIIPVALLKRARTPARLSDGAIVKVTRSMSYGMGRAISMRSKAHWVGHSGGNSTAVRRYPGHSMTIIMLHNGTSNPDALADAIANTMLEQTLAGNAQNDLWDAAIIGNPSALLTAIKFGADVNALDTRSSRTGRYALNWAAFNDHPKIIRILLRHGAAINAQNLSGYTALHHAAESGAIESTKALLAAGADVSLKNVNEETASEVAHRRGHVEVARLIDEAELRTR